MSSISIFSGIFCHGDEVVRKIIESPGFELVGDQDVTSEASRRFQITFWRDLTLQKIYP
jgi:hypothetical protein